MTADLHAKSAKAMRSLSAGGNVQLSSKGVPFGVLRRGANGKLDLTGIRGVSLDRRSALWLEGTATSLRQQIVTSLQQNLGIQAEELVRRLGAGGTLGSGPPGDPDADGVLRATEGMVTALTAYIAALALSSNDLLIAPSFSLKLGRGERLFHSLGCAGGVMCLSSRSTIGTASRPNTGIAAGGGSDPLLASSAGASRQAAARALV